MSTAARPVPSTSAGMSMRLRLATGSSASGTKPDAGSQPRRTDTSRISMIPSQKLGTDTPQSERPLASTSHGVLRRTAAITPAGMAMAMATRSDRHASSSVMGSLVATVPATDCRVRMDSPRSPRTARPSQRTYCTGRGAFRPYLSRISSRPAASASVPASTRAGSPGIIRTPAKTMRLISSSVTAETKARRTRNSNTRLLPGGPLDPDQSVRHRLVALQILGKRHDVVRVIEIDRVPPRRDQVDGLAVERPALGDVADLARLVQQRVDLLVAPSGGGEAAAARLPLMYVSARIHPSPPADQERLVLAVVVVLERGRELLRPQTDVESRLARHALDDLPDPALPRIFRNTPP